MKPTYTRKKSTSSKEWRDKAKQALAKKEALEKQRAKQEAAKLQEIKEKNSSLMKSGNLIGAARQWASKFTKDATKKVIQTVFENNEKAWYIKYASIEPAKNTSRPMGALFNKDITVEAMQGSTCRMMEVHTKWVGYTNSFMWKQTINNSFQLLRLKLKSNLPYDSNKLSVYMSNCITLSIALKQLERDVHWYNYSDPDITDFQELYIRRAATVGTYGLTELEKDKILRDGSWADTVTGYERLVQTAATNIKLPPSLALFISHYFGTMFTDQWDGSNDQYIYLRMLESEWATLVSEKDENGNTKTSINYERIDLESLTVDELTDKVVKLGTEFGVLIADLVNSEQYVPLYLDPVEGYNYVTVYDKTLIQALQNAYTDDRAVTPEGFIRMDQYADIADDLTQFIMLGALQQSNKSLSNVPAITVLSVCLKYNSDNDLNWPAGLAQIQIDAQQSGGATTWIKEDTYFGVNVTTTMESDTYVRILSDEKAVPFAFGTKFKYADGVGQITVNVSGSQFTDTGSELSNTTAAHYYVPICAVENYATAESSWDFPDSAPIYIACFNKGEYPGLVAPPYWKTIVVSRANWIAFQKLNQPLLSELWTRPVASDAELKTTNNYGTASFATLVDSKVLYLSAGSTRNLTGNGGEAEFTITIPANAPWLKAEPNMGNFIMSGRLVGVSVTYSDIERAEAAASTTVSVTTGYSSIAELAAKESHAMIPMYPVHRITISGEGFDNPYSGKIVMQSPLIKHEHIPYYYNVKDLAPTLYNMLTSLFTPVDNIYTLLTKRKGSMKDGGTK